MIFASTVFRFVKLPKDLSLPPRQQPGKSRSWCLTVSWQPSGGSNFNAIVKRQERDLEHSRIGQSGGNLPARVVWLQEVTSKQVFTRWLWLFVYSAWNIHGEIVDVAEQTWLGCRAFVASTSSSLLNWVAFVLFLNIWPYFCQNFVKRGVLFLLFESHSEPLRSIFSDSKDYLPAKKRRLYIQLVEAALYTGHHTSWRS